MQIKINALDTLFFRDGKSFSLGTDTFASGIFPPPMTVFYGALRSYFFSQYPEALKDANTEFDPTKNLIIKDFYFAVGEEIHHPMPMDIVSFKDNYSCKEKLHQLKLVSYPNHTLGLDMILSAQLKNVVIKSLRSDSMINSNGKYYYERGEVDQIKEKLIKYYITYEPKTGVGINVHTGTAFEGQLYRMNMIRPKQNDSELSFVLDFEGIELPDKGYLKLGAEGKGVEFRKCNTSNNSTSLQNTEEFFKIYFKTPVIFENGWLPKWIDPDSLTGILPKSNLRVKLLCAATGKPIYLGGFSMRNPRGFKPMRKAVPQGAVYFFKILEQLSNDLNDKFKHSSLSEFDTHNYGYGIPSFLSIPETQLP